MTTTRRRNLFLLLTVLQVMLYTACFGWRLETWRHAGWAGLGILPELDAGPRRDALSEIVARMAGGVVWVSPDSPAAVAGIVPGDVVLGIDGVSVKSVAKLREEQPTRRRGDALVYTLRDRRLIVTLASPLYDRTTALTVAGGLLAAMICLGLGLAVAGYRPAAAAARVFYAFCAVGGAAFLVGALAGPDFPDLSGLLPLGTQPGTWAVFALELALAVALGNLLLHLVLVFPRPRPVVERWPQIFAALHTVPFTPLLALPLALGAAQLATSPLPWGAAALVLLGAAAALWRDLLTRARRAGWKRGMAERPVTAQLLLLTLWTLAATTLHLLPPIPRLGAYLAAGVVVLVVLFGVLTLYSVWTCGALVRGYRQGDAGARRLLRWPIAGLATALGALLVLSLAVLVATLRSSGAVPPDHRVLNIVSVFLALLVPISFAVGILQDRPGLASDATPAAPESPA